MNHQMVYLTGQPGAGKSTLMRRLTEPFDRLPMEAPVAHDRLFIGISGEVVGAEIGRRRPKFSGTDALASAIIDKAVPWVSHQPYPLLLAEGARLSNTRFLGSAAEAGYDITLALLDHSDAEDWRAIRSKELKRTQNAQWVRGRRTASVNLAEAMNRHPGVNVLMGHPDDLYPELEAIVGAYAAV